MPNPRHKGDTRTFEGLTFSEQAKSINASIVYLQKAIMHNQSISLSLFIRVYMC